MPPVDPVPPVDVDVNIVPPPIPAVPAPDAARDREPCGSPPIAVVENSSWVSPVIRWVIGIPPRAVNDVRLVGRHVNDVRVGGREDIGGAGLLDRLLRVVLQMTGRGCF